MKYLEPNVKKSKVIRVQKVVEKQAEIVVNPTPVTIEPNITVTPTPVQVTTQQVKFPPKQRVEVINPNAEIDYDRLAAAVIKGLPLGYQDDPKLSDPYKFMNVRLTDGKRFYKAIERGIASAASTTFSLEQQSEDQAQTIAYRSDITDSMGNFTKIDYKTFASVDGNTYKKTYNYDNSSRLIGWTGWVRQ